MGAHFFLTGGTGFLGSSLLPRLLSGFPESRITLLLRGTDDAEAAARAWVLADSVRRNHRQIPDAAERIIHLRGDVSLDQCGLSPGTLSELVKSVTHIIHGAASIRFDQPIAEARRVNCGGTRRMLDLALQCIAGGKFERFVYIGTSSVSGRRDGPILEDELETGQSFFNTYEQSKCEAERIVRDHFGLVPCTVFRPSIVIGDSTNGWTSSFNVIYIPLRLLSLGLLRWLPGLPVTTLDLVPVDWVNDAMVHIMRRKDSVGVVYHMTAGPGRAACLGDVVRSAIDYFDRRIPLGSPRAIEFVTQEEFDLLRSGMRGRQQEIMKQLDALLPYIGVERRFDTRNADAMMNASGIRLPLFREYSEQIFAYCLDSNWGKNPGGSQQSTSSGQQSQEKSST